jgi:hypothetical protein
MINIEPVNGMEKRRMQFLMTALLGLLVSGASYTLNRRLSAKSEQAT